MKRPKKLENICLAEHAASYNYHKIQKKIEKIKNIDSSDSDEPYTGNEDYVSSDEGQLTSRIQTFQGHLSEKKNICVIRYVNYHLHQDEMNFY